jgi:hypothetical protein
MSWLMPTELLPIAGMLALILAWPRLHAPTSSRRLFAVVSAICVGTIAACSGLWALYWLVEQRW